MFYVYFLRSLCNSEKIYIGYTVNLKNRIDVHNDGDSIYTAKYKPWTLLGYTAFKKEKAALTFEKYLKSCSGRAFANKHFI